MDARKKEVIIYDTANMKPSPATISRPLSSPGGFRSQTRAKIGKVEGDPGYDRNVIASGMKTKKSQLIAAMVTQLNTSIASCVLTGAEITASELGYSLIVRQSRNKPELRAASIESLKAHGVDGLLVTSAYFQEYASIREFAKLKIPLVVIEVSSMLPGHPKKKAGDFENAYELTEYLIDKGCRRIAYLAADSDNGRHQDLIAGYRTALQNSKLQDSNVWLSNDVGDCWTERCRMLVSADPRPDGIVISNQMITVLAFSDPESPGNRDEFWITCRKGVSASQNQRLAELGKIGAGLAICLAECTQAAVAGGMAEMTRTTGIQPGYK